MIDNITKTAQQDIANTSNFKELDNVRITYLGKKGKLTALLKSLGDIAKEDRPKFGEKVNKVKLKLERLIAIRKDEFELIELKKTLNELPRRKKGGVFESFFAELYRGNGWLVDQKGGRGDAGGDILLYHPKIPETVALIIQVKKPFYTAHF